MVIKEGTNINSLKANVINNGESIPDFNENMVFSVDNPDGKVIWIESEDKRYTINALIQNSQNGCVFLGRDNKLECDVALKIGKSQSSTEKILESRKEAVRTGVFDHPNILKVIDFTVIKDDEIQGNYLPVVVTESLSGVDLLKFVSFNGPSKPDFMVHIFKDFASGLDFIHNKGYIHRDIKPSNIVPCFDKSTNELTCKIIDNSLVQWEGASMFGGETAGTTQFFSPHVKEGLPQRVADDYWAGIMTMYYTLSTTFAFKMKEIKLQERKVQIPENFNYVQLISANPNLKELYNESTMLKLDNFFKKAFTNYEKYTSFKDIVEEFEKAVKLV